MGKNVDITQALVGKTLKSVTNSGDEVHFVAITGEEYSMFHQQDCCESVRVEDITGELDDLVGSPILTAYADSNCSSPDENVNGDSFTWTFYRLSTAKGAVCIRWYGSSNGYYSERVDFEQIRPQNGQ